jgi:hypothetical protein
VSQPDSDQRAEPDFSAAQPGEFVGWPEFFFRTQPPEVVYVVCWPDSDILLRHRLGTGLQLEGRNADGTWWTFQPSLQESEHLSIAAPHGQHEFDLVA